ncbi:hypothetical protein HYC85_006049 [Camellia sinensis]|uniref:Translation elongation factor EFTu/EF1A C-terminal domain-containing protein n=1 Tax=Camellia sinensis TaxID=4442 RepID=A0A7J7I319_CAMSI|nr:hypothetical protein HYC85_006049 [Camellia sinensis]
MFQKILGEALAGDNDGLLLRGVQKVDVRRGMVLAKPGMITPCTKNMRTTNVTGRMASIMNDKDGESKIVMPGDRVKMVVELIMLVACEQGMRFAIREGGKTLGAGVIQSIVDFVLYTHLTPIDLWPLGRLVNSQMKCSVDVKKKLVAVRKKLVTVPRLQNGQEWTALKL